MKQGSVSGVVQSPVKANGSPVLLRRMSLLASVLVIASGLSMTAVSSTAQAQSVNGSEIAALNNALTNPAAATSLLTSALGGNAATANTIISALGGNPTAALSAIVNGSATGALTSALGGSAVNLLSNALGGSASTSALINALGSGNAVNALAGALGTNNAISSLVGSMGITSAANSLVGSLVGNSAAISTLRGILGGNRTGLNALNNVLGGNMGSVGTLLGSLGGGMGGINQLAGALGGTQALGALTNVLGPGAAANLLSGALGSGAIGTLANAIGLNGAVGALVGQLGGNIASVLGVSTLCGIAPLTGTFTTNPCNLTAQNRSIDYALNNAGGGKVTEYLEGWWNDEYLPSMKDMTAQLHASTLDQTRQIGSQQDSMISNNVGRVMQQRAAQGQVELQPGEQSCVMASNAPVLVQAGATSHAIRQGMKNDLTRRAQPVPGTTAEKGQLAVDRERLEEYCTYFHDPATNAGNNACPSPTVAGTLVDGDIDVESILFSDTLDMSKPEVRVSTEALLRNIVQPKVYGKLHDSVLETAPGIEWTMRKERIEAVRKLSADVVAGLVSRRTGIPLPDELTAGQQVPPITQPPAPPAEPPPAVPSGSCATPAPPGDKNAQSLAYAQSKVGSTAYRRLNSAGRVVMTFCQRLSREASRGLVNGGSATEAWNGAVARGIAQTDRNLLQPGDIVYVTSNTPNGRKYGHTGIYAGGGQFISALSRGVYPMALFGGWVPTKGQFRGFVRPSGVGAAVSGCPAQITDMGGDMAAVAFEPPPPPKPVKQLVREIRERAGVPADQIAEDPSYNEIMLALTKEHFFDPRYFVDLADNANSMKHEETALNAFITITLQDIYSLQEQINALVAAKAGLKLEEASNPNRVEATPTRAP